MTFPKLDIKGQYDLQMRILTAPLLSKGDVILKLENYRARITMKAKKYKKNGVDYMKFDQFSIKIRTGKTKVFKLTNLFSGVKSLEEAANELFESNSEFMLSSVYPSLEKNLAEHFTVKLF